MRDHFNQKNLLILILGLLLFSTQICVVTADEQVILVNDKTIHVIDNPTGNPQLAIENEITTISFPVTDEQYNSYDILKIDYQILNPSAGLYLTLTTDESYELCKEGYGITTLGVGNPPLFGSDSVTIGLNKNFPSGNNNLKLISMTRPFGVESDVIYTISLVKTSTDTPTSTQTPAYTATPTVPPTAPPETFTPTQTATPLPTYTTPTPSPSPTYDAQSEIEALQTKTNELEEKQLTLEERLTKQETLVEMIMNYFHSIFG